MARPKATSSFPIPNPNSKPHFFKVLFPDPFANLVSLSLSLSTPLLSVRRDMHF